VPADQELTADAVPDDTLDTVEAGLDEVELALARLDAGTYGRCETCGAQLPEGVLAVAPTARTCEACLP
jgi:RNA polymerase-binding transcription factor DksA